MLALTWKMLFCDIYLFFVGKLKNPYSPCETWSRIIVKVVPVWDRNVWKLYFELNWIADDTIFAAYVSFDSCPCSLELKWGKCCLGKETIWYKHFFFFLLFRKLNTCPTCWESKTTGPGRYVSFPPTVIYYSCNILNVLNIKNGQRNTRKRLS